MNLHSSVNEEIGVSPRLVYHAEVIVGWLYDDDCNLARRFPNNSYGTNGNVNEHDTTVHWR